MAEPVDIATQLMREFAALNTATERAHQAISDMRAERKLLSALLIEVREATQQRAEALIEAAVVPNVEKMNAALLKATDQATDQVFARFEKLAKMITGEEGHPDRPPLAGIIADAKRAGVL